MVIQSGFPQPFLISLTILTAPFRRSRLQRQSPPAMYRPSTTPLVSAVLWMRSLNSQRKKVNYEPIRTEQCQS